MSPRLHSRIRSIPAVISGLVFAAACFSDPYFIEESRDPSVSGPPSKPVQDGPVAKSDSTSDAGSTEQPRAIPTGSGTSPWMGQTNDPNSRRNGSPSGSSWIPDPLPEMIDEPAASDAGVTGETAFGTDGVLVDDWCWPICSGDVEFDGTPDGWNTDDGHACVRSGTTISDEAPSCTYDDSVAGMLVDGACYPPCPGIFVDEDGDGWSQNEGATCVIVGSEIAASAESCPHP